jgi:chromosome segregation ATPase
MTTATENPTATSTDPHVRLATRQLGVLDTAIVNLERRIAELQTARDERAAHVERAKARRSERGQREPLVPDRPLVEATSRLDEATGRLERLRAERDGILANVPRFERAAERRAEGRRMLAAILERHLPLITQLSELQRELDAARHEYNVVLDGALIVHCDAFVRAYRRHVAN